VFNNRQNRLQGVTVNLARIASVQVMESTYNMGNKLHILFNERVCSEPVVMEVSRERNALERCMLQFASFERQTEYDRDRDIYTCRIWFDPADETELLIRVLSFGPVVKVLGPEDFLSQMKERINNQIRRNKK